MAGRKTRDQSEPHGRERSLSERQGLTRGDTAHVFSLTALVECGNEIADSSAVVYRDHKLMSKELGVDLDTLLLEIEFPENEEGGPLENWISWIISWSP